VAHLDEAGRPLASAASRGELHRLPGNPVSSFVTFLNLSAVPAETQGIARVAAHDSGAPIRLDEPDAAASFCA